MVNIPVYHEERYWERQLEKGIYKLANISDPSFGKYVLQRYVGPTLTDIGPALAQGLTDGGADFLQEKLFIHTTAALSENFEI